MMNPDELLTSTHEEILTHNENLSMTWSKYKEGLATTQGLLKDLPQKLSCQVMVPLGTKAMVPGKIVHTNEFLVNLGDSYFVKQTANQAWDICQRKLVKCEEMLANLSKERDLILQRVSTMSNDSDTFGSDDRPEIIEHVTEEEDKEWRKQHRQKEKEYHQKLAELRSKGKTTVETEEDLWKRLEELELEEELEDELNRLHDGASSSEDETEEEEEDNSEVCEFPEVSESAYDSEKTPSQKKREFPEVSKSADNSDKTPERQKKRSVVFEDTVKNIEPTEEPIVLNIKHTSTNGCASTYSNTGIINSPADIHHHYIQSKLNNPKSILKVRKNPHQTKELSAVRNSSEEEEELSSEDGIHFISTGIEIPTVVERQLTEETIVTERQTKKISKFKAQRMKR